LTNLLREQASALLGVDPDTLDPVQQVVNMTSTYGKVERTPRGGIHSIQSTAQTTANEGYLIPNPNNIVAWMKSNPTHAFYFSVWNKPTRLATASPITDIFAGAIESSANSYALSMGTITPATFGPTSVTSHNDNRGTNNTPQLSAQTVQGLPVDFTGQPTVLGRYGLFDNGNFLTPNRVSGRLGKRGARVFYRAFLEDLTVSGRSEETVYALDLEEYTQQVLTPGGHYYGDTVPTDPATYPTT